MADKVSRFAPTGSMDKDSDPRYVGKGDSNGDYIDARNIQCVPQDGNENGTISPTLGNEFAFSLGSVSQQNKRYRITFDGDVAKQHELRFLSTQRDANMVVGTGSNGAVTFNGTQSNFLFQFSAANSGSGVNFSITTPTATTVEIELTSYPMYQWYLESVGADAIVPIVVAEAIPVDLAGPLKDVGSYDLLGDLFIFSTTQDNEPTELSAQIIGVGLTTPLTSLLFDSAHGLVAGQWIRISSSNAPWLNGIFVVNQVISPVEIAVPTVYAWGGAPIPFFVGQEIVSINSNGLGEIGVAVKDENTETWTYTRLLRSVELNFISKKSMDSEVVRDPLRICIYITDNYNPPKCIYHKGGYIQDGLLSFVNPLNQYSFGSILIQTLLQVQGSKIELTLKEQLSSGGRLKPGIKYYTVRQKTSQGNDGPMDFFLGPVYVYSDAAEDETTNEFLQFEGSTGLTSIGYRTRKSNVISIKNLDYNSFYQFDIICMEYLEDVFSSNIIATIGIPSSGEYEYKHTGFEEYVPIDNAQTLSMVSGIFQNSSIVRAKNIRNIDYRGVLSNVKTVADIDLTKWTSTFKHKIVRDRIDASSLTHRGSYQFPERVLTDMGLMYFETYRVACRVFIRGLGWTPYSWIDDIEINTSATNTANPSDNRRIGTIPDYKLSDTDYTPYGDFDPISPNTAIKEFGTVQDSAGTSFPNWYVGIKVSDWGNYYDGATNKYSGDKGLHVPKLEFSIDWSFLFSEMSNRPAYEWVEAIEFGIGDIPQSVKASGISVCSIDGASATGMDGLMEFPFHPKVKSTPGIFKYAGSSPFNFQQVSAEETIIPNYPIVYHLMDLAIAPDITQVGVFADPVNDVLSFYSPDLIVNSAEDILKVAPASSFISFGSVKTKKCITGSDFIIEPASNLWNGVPVVSINVGGLEPHPGYYSEFHPDETNPSGINIYPIEEVIFAKETGNNTLSNGSTYIRSDSYKVTVEDSGNGFDMGESYSSLAGRVDIPVMKLASGVLLDAETQPMKQVRGIVYGSMYKDESSNYRDISFTEYKKIGQTIYFDLFQQPTDIKVNGGDTYTDMFYYKHRDLLFTYDAKNSNVIQEGSMIGFVCQSRVNISAFSPQYPGNPLTDPALLPDPNIQSNWGSFVWPYAQHFFLNPITALFIELNQVSQWARPDSLEHTDISLNGIPTIRQRFYDIIDNFNPSRNPISSITLPSGVVADSRELNTRPSRILWSEIHIQGALKDELRVYLPLNYKDLDLTFGEINHHENINGELFTLQPRKWQRQLFNTRGELQVSGSSIGAIIGDGSVLSRDGQSLSVYGTENKWSCRLGTSSGGKDTIYWFNSEHGVFMRFGADGTLVISESRRLRTFSRLFTKWVSKKDSPAFNEGVRAIWDSASKEVIWTFTGWRELPEWLAVFTEVGEVVKNSNAPSDSYEGFPRFFKCKLVHIGSSLTEPGVGADWETYWEQISYDNHSYYSIFTVAFNEATDGFSTFYGHIPKTYLRWKDTFLSSHPTQRNLIFEHRRGEPTTWYGVDSFLTGTIAPKIEDAYIEAVINDLPEESKRFISTEVLSDNVPDRIEYRTKSQYTWSEPADFKVNDDQFRGFILNDATVSQDPRGNTRRMDGDYIKAKFFFIGGTMNKLYSMVVKLRGRLRDFRQ